MEGIIPTFLTCILVLQLTLLKPPGVYGVRSEEQTTEESQVLNESYKASAQIELKADQEGEIFHDVYRLGPKITDWDLQRAEWLEANPELRFTSKGEPKTILVTSSQSDACPSASGDHYLVKFMKNKIDYARLHEIELYYNMAVMDRRMTGFFIKHPLVRKLMVAHPEAEWIWWMDSDALFTDMSFEIPLEKYEGYNMIIPGWDEAIYTHKSWIGLNAGIFLLRNCQWSLDLLDMWAAMGEDYGDNRENMGALTTGTLEGRPEFGIDDQSALVYLLCISHTDLLKPKVFLENSYDLHGYWIMAMEKLDAKMNESGLEPVRGGDLSFITHFVGCKTCSGMYASYDLDFCLGEMERAFNLADNQVLDMYGFQHEELSSPFVKQVNSDSSHSPLDLLE